MAEVRGGESQRGGARERGRRVERREWGGGGRRADEEVRWAEGGRARLNHRVVCLPMDWGISKDLKTLKPKRI